jgi:putative transposase
MLRWRSRSSAVHYAGRRRTDRARFRLIGVRDAHSGSYWFYLTNLPADELEPESVAQLYACRWQVELIFKELKTHYRLDELPTRKAPIVEALVLSSIITLMLSRKLLDTVRLRLKKLAHRIPESRWAALFADTALNILDLIVLPARTARLLAKRVESMLLHEAVDPNASRLQLLQRVDQGVAWAC